MTNNHGTACDCWQCKMFTVPVRTTVVLPSPPAEPKCERHERTVGQGGSEYDRCRHCGQYLESDDFNYRPPTPEPAESKFCDDCYGWPCICPATHPVICDKCGVWDESGLTPRTASTECDPHDWQPMHIPPTAPPDALEDARAFTEQWAKDELDRTPPDQLLDADPTMQFRMMQAYAEQYAAKRLEQFIADVENELPIRPADHDTEATATGGGE